MWQYIDTNGVRSTPWPGHLNCTFGWRVDQRFRRLSRSVPRSRFWWPVGGCVPARVSQRSARWPVSLWWPPTRSLVHTGSWRQQALSKRVVGPGRLFLPSHPSHSRSWSEPNVWKWRQPLLLMTWCNLASTRLLRSKRWPVRYERPKTVAGVDCCQAGYYTPRRAPGGVRLCAAVSRVNRSWLIRSCSIRTFEKSPTMKNKLVFSLLPTSSSPGLTVDLSTPRTSWTRCLTARASPPNRSS